MSQTTIIIKIKTDIRSVASLCLQILGEGADPTAERDIDVFKRNNSEISNGYVRIAVEDYLIPKLEYAISVVGSENEHMQIVLIEKHGQTRFVTGNSTDENGNTYDIVLGCIGYLPIDDSWA